MVFVAALDQALKRTRTAVEGLRVLRPNQDKLVVLRASAAQDNDPSDLVLRT